MHPFDLNKEKARLTMPQKYNQTTLVTYHLLSTFSSENCFLNTLIIVQFLVGKQRIHFENFFSELWCVVNNAGMVPMGELEIVPVRLFKKAMDVNCIGQVRVTKAFLPLLRAARGRIVNVASVVGK